jgi:hypothetical protein
MKRSSLHAKKPKSARAAWRQNPWFWGDDIRAVRAILRWHRAASRQRIKR